MPLTTDEREGIVIAAESVFRRARLLRDLNAANYRAQGFRAPSTGAVSRDVSEQIEAAIVQHCPTFQKGAGFADLQRDRCAWEVKIHTGAGQLLINQSKRIAGEHYVIVNYDDALSVVRVWTLRDARDDFFTPRVPHLNLRRFRKAVAQDHVDVLFARELTRSRRR